MIAVRRDVHPAAGNDAASLLRALDERPGAWLGCDVAAEGLYERHAVGFAEPALGFYLDGNALRVLGFNRLGAQLLPAIRRLAAFEPIEGGLLARFPGQVSRPHPVLTVLRRFLALFTPAHPRLGLYGAWSFDYFRLAEGEALPDDGRRRFVLYFPERILESDVHGERWIEFAFPGLPPAPSEWEAPIQPPVRLETEADELAPGSHARRVAQGVEALRSGALVSLVLSQAFRRPAQAPASAAFQALRAMNPYPAMFFLNLGGGEKLFGASPDLQVRAEGERVESAPVCGTLRRGADPLADVRQGLALLASEKEAAALSGCADSDINDKAQVCVPGSVELVSHRRVHFFSTIVHTITHTRGRRLPGADGFDVLLAHAAPATVAGVPKAPALEAIARLEGGWRGWYAGAAAHIGCNADVEVYTILRAARVAGGIAEVRTGGNILVDSDPAAEEEESRLKAETLFRVLRGDAPTGRPAAAARGGALRVALRDLGDPFLPRLLDHLARAGIVAGEEGAVSLLTAGIDAAAVTLAGRRPMPRPSLAIGNAAVAVLVADGVPAARLAEPRHARPVRVRADAQAFLAGIDGAQVGLYASHRIEAAGLRPPWRCLARDAEDNVLAAVDEAGRRCALLFRPDSVLSLGEAAGERALRAALDWLAA